MDAGSLLICGACCLKIKRGLTADLAHAAAIMELRNLGYHGETFARTTQAQLARAECAAIEAESSVMRNLGQVRATPKTA